MNVQSHLKTPKVEMTHKEKSSTVYKAKRWPSPNARIAYK